jgi:hypothetical protein
LDGKSQDDKCHTLTLSIEVEANLPVFEKRTIMSTDNYIAGATTAVGGKEINQQKREIS